MTEDQKTDEVGTFPAAACSVNFRRLDDELKDAFLVYLWNLEHPDNPQFEVNEKLKHHYFNDTVYHRKVKNLASGVLSIVQRHIAQNARG